jgi:hypothetical protein
MKRVIRARPKTDRIACPWLIQRIIDPEAEIVVVPADRLLTGTEADPDARSFDAEEAGCTHDGKLCTFEVLIREFDLGDPALGRLARIVHAAHVSEGFDRDPLGPGLLAIGICGLDAKNDDYRLLARSRFVYPLGRPAREAPEALSA